MSANPASVAAHTRRTFQTFSEFEAAVGETHFAWRMRPRRDAPFRAEIRQRLFDDVHFTDVRCDPCEGQRDRADIRGAPDAYVCLTLVAEGGQRFAHGEVSSDLDRGDLLLWDGARPGEFDCDASLRLLTILFPHELAAQHVADVGDLCARKISGSSPTGQLLASHVRVLHETMGQLDPAERGPVLRSTLDLLAVCFRPADLVTAGTGYRTALLRRVQQHMMDRLGEQGLSPSDVAAAFGFSSRYLHRLFAQSGVTFSAWLREARLARALRALASPGFRGETITQIAYRFGFADAAHFSRSFRKRYGITPQQHRAERLGADRRR